MSRKEFREILPSIWKGEGENNDAEGVTWKLVLSSMSQLSAPLRLLAASCWGWKMLMAELKTSSFSVRAE